MDNKSRKNKEVVATTATETASAVAGATASPEAKKGPLKSFREGDVSASVWAHDHGGRVYYSCGLQRSYIDSKQKRRYTSYFSMDELKKVMSLAQQAWDYLYAIQYEKPEEPEAQG
jgi:hypothetical protein